MKEIVILNCSRTPMGDLQGNLSSLSAPKLGAESIENAISNSKISKAAVDEVIMGLVLSAGIGQAPARQAAIYAGLANTIGATTINKMCGL